MKERNKQTVKFCRDLLEQYKMALLVLAVGVFLMLLPTAAGGGEQSQTTVEEGFDLAAFERRLEQTLSNIEGAGKTRVMLSVKSDGQQILAQNVEQDGARTTATTVSRWSTKRRRWKDLGWEYTTSERFRGVFGLFSLVAI